MVEMCSGCCDVDRRYQRLLAAETVVESMCVRVNFSSRASSLDDRADNRLSGCSDWMWIPQIVLGLFVCVTTYRKRCDTDDRSELRSAVDIIP